MAGKNNNEHVFPTPEGVPALDRDKETVDFSLIFNYSYLRLREFKPAYLASDPLRRKGGCPPVRPPPRRLAEVGDRGSKSSRTCDIVVSVNVIPRRGNPHSL